MTPTQQCPLTLGNEGQQGQSLPSSALGPDPPGVDSHKGKPRSELVASEGAWREKLKTATYVTLPEHFSRA